MDETSYSKFISLILRHKPEVIGIKLDEHGWANVKELLEGINASGREMSFADLVTIVQNDSKTRYSFNEDRTKIRANQGHSVKVDVELKDAIPPDILYHGTTMDVVDKIIVEGLKPMSRLYVHLSKDKQTAEVVGNRRHRELAIFEVNTKQMHYDGYPFFISENEVWLVEGVPPKYLKLIQ